MECDWNPSTKPLLTSPNKDTEKKEDYKPVSLRSTDAKILNKIIANRIKLDIKTIMGYWFRFTPELQGWLNICKSINVIYYIK